MDLNVDINKLVESEIKRQVQNVVEQKLKELTMTKLRNMGYDVKRMIESIIREEARKQLDTTGFVEQITKEEIINRTAQLFNEQLFDAIDRRDYNY